MLLILTIFSRGQAVLAEAGTDEGGWSDAAKGNSAAEGSKCSNDESPVTERLPVACSQQVSLQR